MATKQHSKPEPEVDLDAQLLAVVELRALLLDSPDSLTSSGARNRLQRIREVAELVLKAAERALVSPDLQEDGPVPVDDWIDDYTNPHIYARFWLHHARLPAHLQHAFAPIMGNIKLFCSWRGKRYRVAGASSWGDIWLNRDFDKGHGHDERVPVTECYEWSDKALDKGGSGSGGTADRKEAGAAPLGSVFAGSPQPEPPASDLELAQLRAVLKAASAFFTTPFVDSHGSTATWVGAEMNLRSAIAAAGGMTHRPKSPPATHDPHHDPECVTCEHVSSDHRPGGCGACCEDEEKGSVKCDCSGFKPPCRHPSDSCIAVYDDQENACTGSMCVDCGQLFDEFGNPRSGGAK